MIKFYNVNWEFLYKITGKDINQNILPAAQGCDPLIKDITSIEGESIKGNRGSATFIYKDGGKKMRFWEIVKDA